MIVELQRQLRRRRTRVGLVGIAAVPILLAVAFVLTAGDGNGGGNGGDPTGLFALATASGLNFALMSTAATAPFLLLAVIALFTGDTVSSEASWGSLRYLLVRPVPRGRLLGRKLAVGLVLSLAAVILVPVSGLVAGTVAFGWGDVQTPFGVLPVATAILRLAVIVAYLAWSSLWLASLAFALSTTTDSAVGAVAGSIVLVIVVQILDAISALGEMRRWLPVHEGDAWVGVLATPARYADLSRGIWLQIPYVVVFLAFAWWWFARRDVLS